MNKKQFYQQHTNCPKCNSGNVTKTDKKVKDKSPFTDDINDAACNDCDWKGKLKNLVPSPELQKQEQVENTYVSLVYTPVVAPDGNIYLPAEQVVNNLALYGQKTVEILNNQDQDLSAIKAAVGYSDEKVSINPSDVNECIVKLYNGIANNQIFNTREDAGSVFLVDTAKKAIECILFLAAHANTKAIITATQFYNDNASIITQYAQNVLDEVGQLKENQENNATPSDTTTPSSTDSSPRLTIVKD